MLRPLSREWEALRRRLTRLTGDAAAAEDVLQDAFVRLEEYRRADHVVKDERALFVCSANTIALDHRRRAKRRASMPLETFETTLADGQPLQDEVLAARERLSAVRAVVARLPERTRDVFLMHRLEGLKYPEIATRFGISVSAVEKHVARAAFHLAQALQGDGEQG